MFAKVWNMAVRNRRLLTATICSVGVVLVLYAALLGNNANSNNEKSSSKLRVGGTTNQPDLAGLGLFEKKSHWNAQNCPRLPAVTAMAGRPVWVAGYPGSGFDLVTPLVAAITGLTAVDIYRHHSCTVPLQAGAALTGACLTHWPLVPHDSPASVAVSTGIFYSPRAILVMRNPAQAIPSYHTRWWGAQQKIHGNHDQPPKSDWIEWRDKRFEHHLLMWKMSIVEWQRGIPAANIRGVSMYVPFEELVDVKSGPVLTTALARQFISTLGPKNPVADVHQAACLWRRTVDDEDQQHDVKAKRRYEATYTPLQKDLFLQTLDDLLLAYASPSKKETVLTKILQRYRADIANLLTLDNDN